MNLDQFNDGCFFLLIEYRTDSKAIVFLGSGIKKISKEIRIHCYET